MGSLAVLRKFVVLVSVVLNDLSDRSTEVFDNSYHISSAFQWLMNAQDAVGKSGGVSEGYHLLHGWLPPYPETTGYIIETFFDYFHLTGDEQLKSRALRMADWLVSIQNPDGSVLDSYFKKKMVFDTGQVIFGLVRAYEETGNSDYLDAAVKAGNWLVEVQEQDGTWQRFAVDNIPHTYYSRVAWSLAKLHSMVGDARYLDACLKNIEWSLSRQEQNGWFNDASFNFSNHHRPFTHTIAYTIRGILETGIYVREDSFINAVTKAVEHLITTVKENGFVGGTYDREWKGDDTFCCLTGSAQLAIIMFKLFQLTKENKYLETGRAINRYLKSRQQVSIKRKEVYGGIAGSWPIWGRYIHFTYPNWAAKFFIDSLMIEEQMLKND